MSEALTKSEKKRLTELVNFIREHITTFVDVGNALLEIRRKCLHREYGSFQDFCIAEFLMNRAHAYRLCDAATVVNELKSVSAQKLPVDEYQCRPLVKLGSRENGELVFSESLSNVWSQVLSEANGSPVTASMVKGAVEAELADPVDYEEDEQEEDAGPSWTRRQQSLRRKAEKGETVVINMNEDHALMEWALKNYRFVRIDRATDWGNPFLLDGDGDRDAVCDNFEKHYFKFKPSLKNRINELSGGKVLGCHCAPKRCHGDCLAMEANK